MSAMKGKMTVTAVLSTIIGDIVKMVSVPPGAVVPPPTTEPPPGGGGAPYPDQGLPQPQPRPEHPIVYPPEMTHPMVPPPPGTSIPPTGGQPLPPGGGPGGGTDAPHPEHPIYFPPGTRPEAGQDLPGYQPPAGWPEGCPYPTPYGLDRALSRGLEGGAVVGELTIITTEGASRPGQVYDVEFTLVPGATVEPGAKGGGGKSQGQGQSGASTKPGKPKSNFP